MLKHGFLKFPGGGDVDKLTPRWPFTGRSVDWLQTGGRLLTKHSPLVNTKQPTSAHQPTKPRQPAQIVEYQPIWQTHHPPSNPICWTPSNLTRCSANCTYMRIYSWNIFPQRYLSGRQPAVQVQNYLLRWVYSRKIFLKIYFSVQHFTISHIKPY